MANPLDVREAYLAGILDAKRAEICGDFLIEQGFEPESHRAAIIRRELQRLHDLRVNIGEVPTELPQLQVAS